MNRLLQTTSKQREKAGDYSADEYMGMVGDLEYRLSFPQEGEADTLFRIKEDLLQYRPMDGATGVITSSAEGYNTSMSEEYGELSDINECSLSIDEARQMAEEFLDKIGGSRQFYRVSQICAGYIGMMVNPLRSFRLLSMDIPLNI